MHVFLEAEEGLYVLKVSPYAAGRPTAMHKRGKPFPASYRTEYKELELAAIGLQELTEYYKCYEEKKVSKKRAAS
jgi:hypothetical protein